MVDKNNRVFPIYDLTDEQKELVRQQHRVVQKLIRMMEEFPPESQDHEDLWLAQLTVQDAQMRLVLTEGARLSMEEIENWPEQGEEDLGEIFHSVLAANVQGISQK